MSFKFQVWIRLERQVCGAEHASLLQKTSQPNVADSVKKDFFAYAPTKNGRHNTRHNDTINKDIQHNCKKWHLV